MLKSIECAKMDGQRVVLAFDADTTTYATITLWAYNFENKPFGQVDITYSQHLNKYDRGQNSLVSFKRVELKEHDLFTSIVIAARVTKALTDRAVKNREKYLNQIFTKWGV